MYLRPLIVLITVFSLSACESEPPTLMERHNSNVEAVNLKPFDAEARYNLGATYLELKKHQSAIEHFKDAVRLENKHSKAHRDLGVTYLILKNRRHHESH